ncbi:MAG: uroporphyrinogen-III synthase, partial [Mariprofundaceae bacterium]|nr:uroporphyrinogen-III synthase [Mariprofundaceae bacterium]
MVNSPLTNKRILITRAAQQVAETTALIEAKEATAIAFPCLEYQILKDSIQQGLNFTKDYSDIVFTSVNGIQAVFENNLNSIVDDFQEKHIAVVGTKTAAALKKYGLQASIIPKISSQQGLIQHYQEHGLPQSVLFFRAEDGSDELLEYLQKQGIKTRLVTAYRSFCPTDDNNEILTMLKENSIDVALLGSSKTAAHYLQRIGNLELANRPVLVAISQQVADAADKLGLKVQLIAKQANFPSMLESLAEYFSQ